MSGSAQGEILACHECDLLHRYAPIAAGAKASCHRCGAFLYRHVQDSLDRSLALYVAALLLFILANVFPFLSLTLGGRVEDNVLLSSAWAMYEMGMGRARSVDISDQHRFPTHRHRRHVVSADTTCAAVSNHRARDSSTESSMRLRRGVW